MGSFLSWFFCFSDDRLPNFIERGSFWDVPLGETRTADPAESGSSSRVSSLMTNSRETPGASAAHAHAHTRLYSEPQRGTTCALCCPLMAQKKKNLHLVSLFSAECLSSPWLRPFWLRHSRQPAGKSGRGVDGTHGRRK